MGLLGCSILGAIFFCIGNYSARVMLGKKMLNTHQCDEEVKKLINCYEYFILFKNKVHRTVIG